MSDDGNSVSQVNSALALSDQKAKERVERLMREHGIYARHKRRYKVTTDARHGLPVAQDLLDRNFTPTAPN